MDILQVLEGLAYVGFIAGAIFAVMELRGLTKDRRMDLFLRCTDHITSEEFESALSKVWRSTVTDAKELEKEASYKSLAMIADYYEALANMTTEGAIERRIALENFPFDHIWDKMGPWMEYERTISNAPGMYRGIEDFAKLQKAGVKA